MLQRRYVYDMKPKVEGKWSGKKTTLTIKNLVSSEIDIDSWLLIPSYLEIEGASIDLVYSMLSALGYQKEDCTSKDVQSIYADYGYDLEKIEYLKLEEERI